MEIWEWSPLKKIMTTSFKFEVVIEIMKKIHFWGACIIVLFILMKTFFDTTIFISFF